MNTSATWTAVRPLAALAIVLFASAPALASKQDDPWKQASVRSGVPVEILHAIALTESSKRWSDGTTRPWPYTLNSELGPMYFRTLQEASSKLSEILASGITNVDIGMMQVNCGYHCRRVSSPADLLDPHTNLLVAADILREARGIKGELGKSVGAYHAGYAQSRAKRSQWYQDTVAQYVRRLRGRA